LHIGSAQDVLQKYTTTRSPVVVWEISVTKDLEIDNYVNVPPTTGTNIFIVIRTLKNKQSTSLKLSNEIFRRKPWGSKTFSSIDQPFGN